MTKSIVRIAALFALVALLFASCGAGNSPAGVAENFLTAIKNLDFEKAATFATDEAKPLLDMMKGFMTNLTDEQKAEAEKQKTLPLKIGKVEETGDTAKVYYTIGDQEEQFVDLVKVEGNWKVKFDKGS